VATSARPILAAVQEQGDRLGLQDGTTPWGSAYKGSRATEDEVTVFSPGPDKREGTADDISVPKAFYDGGGH